MKIAEVGDVMKNIRFAKKILVTIIIFIMMILTNNIKTFALENYFDSKTISEEVISTVEIATSDFHDPTEDPGWWEPNPSEEKELAEKAGILLGVINVLGVVSAVIALVLLGMKYFLGSVEEKAEFKKSLLPYILGIVLLVACTTLPNIIYNISQGVFK